MQAGDTKLSDGLAALFRHVKDKRKIDFGIYRPDTIARRLNLLLSKSGTRDYHAYLELLKSVPSEMNHLITTLTITTSHFFRNPHIFELLAEKVIPEMLKTFKNETLRIWCAGCGRGEEAYSLAILIQDCIRNSDIRIMPVIMATDIDGKALKEAADGCYGKDVLDQVSMEQLGRYFVPAGDNYRVNDLIRQMVTFALHDVITCRPPSEGIFSDYHLIFCRNVMIYFNRETQTKVLRCLSDMLRPNGYLVLGEAEMFASHEFHEVSARTKIFHKRGLTV